MVRLFLLLLSITSNKASPFTEAFSVKAASCASAALLLIFGRECAKWWIQLSFPFLHFVLQKFPHFLYCIRTSGCGTACGLLQEPLGVCNAAGHPGENIRYIGWVFPFDFQWHGFDSLAM